MTSASPEQPDASPPDPIEVVVRKATAADLATLVIPSWLASYARSFPAKMMRADTRHAPGRDRYWSGMRARIERVLSTSTTAVLVADVAGMAAGWACEDRSRRELHYVYVRENFRRQGIARRLCGWIDDAQGDLVFLTALPPPWFTMGARGADGQPTGRPLWRPHQVIDTITSF